LTALALIAAYALWLHLCNGRAGRQAGQLGLVVFAIGLLWAGVHQLELRESSPDGTYGSDARYYYTGMLQVVGGNAPASSYLAPLFVSWGAWLLSTASTRHPFWVVLGNLGLYVVCTSSLYLALVTHLRSHRHTESLRIVESPKFMLLSLVLALNGLVLWMVIREIKESLLLAILAVSVYWIEQSMRTRPLALGIGVAAVAAGGGMWLLARLRALGALLIAGYALFDIYGHLGKRSRLVALLAVSLAMVPALSSFSSVKARLDAQRDLLGSVYPKEEATQFTRGAAAVPLSALRFVLGPGPSRSLRQLLTKDVFVVSTRTGDVMIFLGACQWWLLLAVAAVMAVSRRGQVLDWARQTSPLLLLSLMHLAPYCYVAAGSGDARHRGVLYVLLHLPLALLLCLPKGRQHPDGAGDPSPETAEAGRLP